MTNYYPKVTVKTFEGTTEQGFSSAGVRGEGDICLDESKENQNSGSLVKLIKELKNGLKLKIKSNFLRCLGWHGGRDRGRA